MEITESQVPSTRTALTAERYVLLITPEISG